MSYIKQIITVTRWEFSRFFKPKNELIGIIIMLFVSAVFYIGTKYALSDKSPKIEIFLQNDNDGALTELLQDDFTVKQLPAEQKESFMAVLLSFAYQFTAITEEKQLKITEQIVSAISPQVWMDGKILGISLTGISSMITYSLLSIIGGILYFQFTGVPASVILEYLYLPSIALYLPYALIGVLIWNAILAAIASVITDPNNSGKSSIMMLPLVFVLASFLVTRDPDSGLSVFLSWFPLTSATSMPMRWAITEVGVWQLAGSFLLLILAFYFLRKIAAEVFRVSILMTGKEPSWSEVYKSINL